jgi:DNA polymerase III epsilon subunit-like protein
MEKATKIAVPEAAAGIQVNFCKTPGCPNFGEPFLVVKRPRGRPPKGSEAPNQPYIPLGNPAYLKCRYCKISFPLKSNQGIHEELTRLNSYMPPDADICTNPECTNHKEKIRVTAGKGHYTSHGPLGKSHRYKCQACGRVFTVSHPSIRTDRQKLSYINKDFFKLLTGKMPMRRICGHFDISTRVFYDKIDFLYDRCLAFAANRERKLLHGMRIDRLYLSVDQQDLAINWPSRVTRKNIQFKAVGVADNETMYVFASFLNYDRSLNRDSIEACAEEIGDNAISPPFRLHARLWLIEDHIRRRQKGSDRTRPELLKKLRDQILAKEHRQRAQEDEDIESGEFPTEDKQLPATGMQIHNEYTLYALFLYLKQRFAGAKKIRFFMDRDSGLRAACLAGFADDIYDGRCDAFYVVANRSLTQDQKLALVDESKELLRRLERLHPDKKKSELMLIALRERMQHQQELGRYRDRWLQHPFTDMNEAEVRSALLTNLGQYEEKEKKNPARKPKAKVDKDGKKKEPKINSPPDHLAYLHNLASLKGVDQYFMNVRRRLSLLERPIDSGTNVGRKWYGYSPYSPWRVIQLLHIFRVWYNYVRLGDDDKTPAMRLGMARGPVKYEDIIYGRRYSDYSFRKKAKTDKQAKWKEDDRQEAEKKALKKERGRMGRFLRTTHPSKIVFLSALRDEDSPNNGIFSIALVNATGRLLFDELINPGSPLSARTEKAYPVTDALLAGKHTVEWWSTSIASWLERKIVVAFDLAFNVKTFPEDVVTCVSGFETYMDFQRALQKRSTPLKPLAVKLGFKWNGLPEGAHKEAEALRLVWAAMAGWDPRDPMKAFKKLPKKRKTAPVKATTQAHAQPPQQVQQGISGTAPPPAAQAGLVQTPTVAAQAPQLAQTTSQEAKAAPTPAPLPQQAEQTIDQTSKAMTRPQTPIAPIRVETSNDLETVFLDTETTGLDKENPNKKIEVVEIAIVGEAGQVLYYHLCNHEGEMTAKAFAKHRITPAELEGKPLFKQIENEVAKIVDGKRVVMYNSEFDLKRLTPKIRMAIAYSECAMLKFAEVQKLRQYAKLEAAAAVAGHIRLPGERSHRAVADARACRSVWRYILKQEASLSCLPPSNIKGGLYGIEDIY